MSITLTYSIPRPLSVGWSVETPQDSDAELFVHFDQKRDGELVFEMTRSAICEHVVHPTRSEFVLIFFCMMQKSVLKVMRVVMFVARQIDIHRGDDFIIFPIMCE